MGFVNYLASALEALKVSNPKRFAIAQFGLFALFFLLNAYPELALEYISSDGVDLLTYVLVGLGFSVSSSTTNYLPPTHKKILAIKQKEQGDPIDEPTKL